MLRAIIYLIFSIILAFSADAGYISSPAGVRQSGTVITGDCVEWVGNNLIQDSGGTCGGGGGGGTPGGSQYSIQYNAGSGNFGGLLATDGQLLFGQATGAPAWNTVSGDFTFSDTGVATLATVNSNVGTFQGLTVNAKGLVTAATSQSYLTAPVANASLANSAMNIGGQTISLGGATTNQGNGGKIQLSTGTTTTNDCVKFDANGNTVDAGSACGSGGGDTITSPNSTLTIGGTATNTTIDFNLSNANTWLAPQIIPLGNGSTAITQSTGDNSTDIATDAFVQAQISAQVEMHDAVQAATTAALIFSPTYNNGSSGVGATLTAGTVGVLILDGYTPNLGDRLLIKNQAAPLQNGCYTVTTLGVAITTDYVLTRCTDFNQVANIDYGDTFPVLQGTVNANQQFTMNNSAFTSVGGGTSASQITFSQTSGGSQLAAGTGITIAGNTVANSGVLSFTGDGTIINNSASTGAVTDTLVNAAANSILGNNTGSSAAPAYQQSVVVQSVNTVNHAITVSSNAGTASLSFTINTFTNSSAATMAITIPTSGAVDGQMIIVRIYDFSAVAETIGWTNTENSTVTAPTTSNGSTTLPLTVGFMWNAATSKWRCIALA